MQIYANEVEFNPSSQFAIFIFVTAVMIWLILYSGFFDASWRQLMEIDTDLCKFMQMRAPCEPVTAESMPPLFQLMQMSRDRCQRVATARNATNRPTDYANLRQFMQMRSHWISTVRGQLTHENEEGEVGVGVGGVGREGGNQVDKPPGLLCRIGSESSSGSSSGSAGSSSG